MAEQTQSKVPEIRFSGFEGAWDDTTLGDSLPITSAARVHKDQWTKSGVRFFRSSDVVSNYKGKENEKAFISHELYRELTDKIGRIHRGDILVTGGGSIGIPYLVDTDEPLYFKDADLLWLKVRDALDSKFLYIYFSSRPFRKYVKSISHIGTIAHYTVEQAKSTPIKLPAEFDEQILIGKHFAKLDAMISQHQRKHAKLVALKKAMLQKMFPRDGATTPEIRFKGFSGDWEEKALGEIAEIIGGGTPSTATPEYWDGDIDWYSPTEIGNSNYATGSKRKITKLGLNKCSARILPAERTVLFTSRAGIGDMAILKRNGATNQGFQSLVLNEGIDAYFIYSLGFEIKSYALTNASGSTFLEISGKQLGRMEMLIPCENEQKTIGNYFRELDELTERHSTQITKLRNIKAACLEKMFV